METKERNQLCLGGWVNTEKVTLLAGRVYPEGAILAEAATTHAGKYKVVDDTDTTNGAIKPEYILMEEVDATLSDKTAGVYQTGEIDVNLVKVEGTKTAREYKKELRQYCLILKEVY